MSGAPLHERLALEQVAGCDIFISSGQDTPWGRVYGGQVLAQSLGAANRTVPSDQRPHSCHAYFLLAGECGVDVLFEVERVRDGKSFSTRVVKAKQHGKAIFQMSVSFHRDEDSPSFQAPEKEFRAIFRSHGVDKIALPEDMLKTKRPAPLISADVYGETESLLIAEGYSWKMAWCRYKNPQLPDHMQYAGLAWASDANFGRVVGGAGFGRHPENIGMMMSLDHSIHFHRPVRVDDWLLYHSRATVYTGARGYGRTEVFTRDGILVATINQEVLARPKQPMPHNADQNQTSKL